MTAKTAANATYCREKILANLIPAFPVRRRVPSDPLLQITVDALYDSLTIDQQQQVVRYLSYYIKQRYGRR